jgi:NAD(P)-dependent dehydrogenase (short-subunit alcohol dehydrogenase family)
MPSRSRTVLLTGAAGGTGPVMARALLDDGHSVLRRWTATRPRSNA